MEVPNIKVSICVGIKNRTKSLLNNLISSLNNCIGNDGIELSIYDCGSTDTKSLYEDIKLYWKGQLVYNSEEHPFERSYSFNKAVKQSSNSYIFLCDADISLPEDFIIQYYKNVDHNTCWFPICFSLAKGRPKIISEENGWWRESGYGMVGITKELYQALGGLDESYKTWGGEDIDFYNRVNVEKRRERCIGLFHNWHPSPNNIKTTPIRFRHLEETRKLVLGVTTYNRLQFLKECINSWNKTRGKKHSWVLVVADDGSTDGTREYLDRLNIEGVEKHLIFNYRKGVHYQTNTILKYCSTIEFDYGFKIDDDILFLKAGWDNLYINAIEKTGFSHLCFFDIAWGKRRGCRQDPVILDNILVSYIAKKDVQGAFWTFTPEIIEKVGYFDVKNFGFCGYGHIDYTFRCARAGFNDINNIYDCINSNEYITINKKDYVPAIPDKIRYSYNTREEIQRKMEIIKDSSRRFIDFDFSYCCQEDINMKTINFLFYNNFSRNIEYLSRYIKCLQEFGFNTEVYYVNTILDNATVLTKSAAEIKEILEKGKIVVIDSWSLFSYTKDIKGIKRVYFVSPDELSQLMYNKESLFVQPNINKYILVTDVKQVKYELLKKYKVDVILLENKRDIYNFFDG